MKKIYYLLLGISPSLIPFSINIIDMMVQKNYNLENKIRDSGIDDWNEKYIVIDFSVINTIQDASFKKFDLEIEKKIKINKNGKKEIIINWKYYSDGKWSNIHKENTKWTHKVFWIGEMINDFFKDNQKILFKNLVQGNSFGYDISQPDAMIAQLFMIVFKLDFSTITVNYTSPNWFIAITSIGGFYVSIEEAPKHRKIEQTRKGRHELNLDYFSRNKNYEKYIMDKCLNFIFNSDIFSKYNIEDLWNKNFIKFF